jgi:hypothetical protein
VAGFLSRLFGGGRSEQSATAHPPEVYEGYTITPNPIAVNGQWRIAARIEKDGRVHDLMRADTMADRDECAAASAAKARQAIDQLGDRVFD